MDEVAIFSYTDHEVRAIAGADGTVRFVGADVTAALGYAGGGRNAVSQLPDRMKGVEEINTPGGLQKVTVITEPGVYRLAMRSNLPSAEAFQDWISEDVVPSIRKTGSYGQPVQAQIPQTYAEALRLAADQAEQIAVQASEIATLAPGAEAWEKLATANGDYAVADAAKILCRDPLIDKIGQQRLFTYLDKIGWIHRNKGDRRWRVYQSAVDSAWITELASSHYHPRTGELVLDAPQVRITVKGLGELHKRLRHKQQPIPNL